MNKKNINMVIGALNIFFWFLPFTSWKQNNVDYFQAGYHLNGPAFLILAGAVLVIFFAWQEVGFMALLGSLFVFGTSMYYLKQAGEYASYGLTLLIISSFISIIIGLFMMKDNNLKNKT